VYPPGRHALAKTRHFWATCAHLPSPTPNFDFKFHRIAIIPKLTCSLFSHFPNEEDIKDHDPTPRPNPEQWRFTPSLLDPNSYAFTSFANQPPGYYTPTPGGTNTLYHSQAGDLHTPGFSFGLGTPLSLATSEGGLHAGHSASGSHLHGFNPHALGTHHHFPNQNPFALQSQHAPAFAPHQFTHGPSAFEHPVMPQTHENSPMDNAMQDVEMQSPLIGYTPQTFADNVQPVLSHQPTQK
jgi:hypothetical protein